MPLLYGLLFLNSQSFSYNGLRLRNQNLKIMMKQIYIMVGVIAVLLVIQRYLRYKFRKEKEEREYRRFGK
jgi:hypothetical protein